ncbi:MAG: hypothetical protein OXB98_05070 [Bryobacterales bacterium]|nr:hypothetical protein [Bryobacterales bacterium]
MSDKLKQEYQNKLGEEFGAVFHGLRNDWAWGLMRTKEFRELFSNAEDVELLNSISGGGFLWDIQHIFWDDLMLRVTRLTDPIRTAGKANLTVQGLPDFCTDPELCKEVRRLVGVAVDAAGFARDWRNQRISHRDLTQAISPNAEPLAPANLRQVETALDAVHAILNVISERLLDSSIANDIVIRPRTRAFVSYVKQLVEAVQYIDSFIDPSGNLRITDHGAASDFLQKLGYKPTMEKVKRIIELREAARRFK